MFNINRIHTRPVALPDNVVKITTTSSIPAELKGAIRVINCKVQIDTIDGIKTVPTSSLICFEKSNQTPSGYNCWLVAGPHTNLITIDGTLHIKPPITHAMLIPDKEEARPLWVARTNITYNGNGTATIHTADGDFSGRIGVDFLLCHGMKKGCNYNVSLLRRSDESYDDYIVCDESGQDLGMLSELFPA